MKHIKHLITAVIGLFLLACSMKATAQQTMYWIGGTGNWDDLRHWSFQSGSPGSTLPSSIPNANTHVIIDANSGFNGATNKSINTTAAVHIKSLTFTPDLHSNNSPYISGQNNITVYGNVTLQPHVTLRTNKVGTFLQINMLNGEVATLTNHGAVLEMEFAKVGLGKLIVADNFNNQNNYSFRTMLQEGTVEYLGDTLQTDALLIEGQTLLNMPELTTLLLTYKQGLSITNQSGSFAIKGSPTMHFPKLETIRSETSSVGGCLEFVYGTIVELHLPALKTMDLGGIYGSSTVTNYHRTVFTVPDDATINLTNPGWKYSGEVAPSKFTLNLNDGKNGNISNTLSERFTCNNINTKFHKVVIQANDFIVGIRSTAIIDSLIFVDAGGEIMQDATTVGTLRLAPRRTLSLSTNVRLHITKEVTSSVDLCDGLFGISGASGSQLVNQTGAPMVINHAEIKNLTGSGNTIQVYGVDLGNPTPGTLSFLGSPPSKTLYWTGTSGDNEWNTSGNWSDNSGGIGGACLPTSNDNVIFDANSSVTGNITVTGPYATFHDITIQDELPNENLTFTGATIACYGSWYMKQGVTINQNVLFQSKDLGETITSNGSKFSTLYLSGEGGWTLGDSLTTLLYKNLYFLGGTFNSNKKNMYIGASFDSRTPANAPIASTGKWNLNITDSKISVYQTWDYSTNGTLQAEGSTLEFRYSGSLTSSPNHRYHDVILLPGTYSDASLSISGGNNTSFSDILAYRKSVFVTSNIKANSLRLITEQKGSSISFRNNAEIGILEVPANGILRAQVNTQLTIRDQLITHTEDCSGSMEMYATQVNSSVVALEGTFFKLRALEDIFIAHVIMTGVQADLSTGASYKATGSIVRDVKNWEFIDTESKDLYWIGATDNKWFNPDNWSTNSDGSPSGGCLPTRTDNVRFNRFSNRNLPIVTEGAIVSINNLIADEDCPENLEIQHRSGTSLHIYGDRIEMGRGMFIHNIVLYSTASVATIINRSSAKQASGASSIMIQAPTTTWIFRGNMFVQSSYGQYSVKEVFSTWTPLQVAAGLQSSKEP